MKKLLFQLDTDAFPSVFDTVVGYDGGADHVIGHANVTTETVVKLVEGAIFTRAPKEKKNTAIFVGGSNLQAGQEVFDSVTSTFFSNFRVSVMLDSNGSNTTAAAGVARLKNSTSISGKKTVILAGTGPVGQRAGVLLAKLGAKVSITSRSMTRATDACKAMSSQYHVELNPVQAVKHEDRAEAIQDAQIVFACGAAGVGLLKESQWSTLKQLEVVMDANATPDLGIEGVDMMDRGEQRHEVICWGAIGFGTLKLDLHRTCISRLFEDNKTLLNIEEIFSIAEQLAG